MKKTGIGFIPTDIAWLAGLLEGEGSFSIKNVSAEISIAMSDKDILDRAAQLTRIQCPTK